MTMTLIDVRDWHLAHAKYVHLPITNALHKELADAIDAHIAAMGEPVAYCCPDDPYNSTAFSWPGTARVLSRHTVPLFSAPPSPIDVDAVRETTAQLRLFEAVVDGPCKPAVRSFADKLEAALGGKP